MNLGDLLAYLRDDLVHVGYTLTLLALLARDVLWLRVLLAAAQANLSAYSYYRGIESIALWNVIFVGINLLWAVRILRERRAVELPGELAEIHQRSFMPLSAAEFLRLWSQGERRVLRDQRLTQQGAPVEALYFLLRGTVCVREAQVEIASLGRGDFVGEMSLLTGGVATADAQAVGEVELMRWPTAQLLRLRERNPALWTKIQSVLGRDLVAKIQRHAVQRPVAAT